MDLGLRLQAIFMCDKTTCEPRELTFYPRELCQIVNNDLAGMDIIVDEGDSLFWSVSA